MVACKDEQAITSMFTAVCFRRCKIPKPHSLHRMFAIASDPACTHSVVTCKRTRHASTSTSFHRHYHLVHLLCKSSEGNQEIEAPVTCHQSLVSWTQLWQHHSLATCKGGETCICSHLLISHRGRLFAEQGFGTHGAGSTTSCHPANRDLSSVPGCASCPGRLPCNRATCKGKDGPLHLRLLFPSSLPLS